MLSFKITAILFSSFLILGVIALTVNQFTAWPVGLYASHEFLKYILVVLAALVWAACMLYALKTNTPERKIALYLYGFLYTVICSHFVFPDIVSERKAPSEFLATVPVPKDAALVTFRRPFQDVCWVYKRADAYMFVSRGEIDYGLKYPEAKHRHLPDVAALRELIRREKEKGKEVYFVSRTDVVTEDYKDTFPPYEWRKSSAGNSPDGYSVVKF